jgi:branched-chain amino acid transport system substrate-binding protein
MIYPFTTGLSVSNQEIQYSHTQESGRYDTFYALTLKRKVFSLGVIMKQIFYPFVIAFLSFIFSNPGLCNSGKLKPIRVGAVLALTGDQAAPSHAFLEGIHLALDEVNEKPIWENHKLEVIVEDGQLLPRQSYAGIKKLIDIDDVTALITGSVIESKAGASLINNAKVPTITLWDASRKIEALGKFVFSIGLWTPSSAEVAASFAQSKLGKHKPYIFNSEDEWSAELEEAFRKQISDAHGQIIGVSTFNPGETDFRSSIAKAQKSGADILYVTIGYNISTFFRQLRQSNWNVPVITSDIISESLIRTSPTLYEGVYQTQIFTPVAPRTAHMIKLYEKKYHRDCDWLPWVSWGYDSIHLFAQALSDTGPDGEKIAEHLASLKGYQGASGEMTMTPSRSAPRRPDIFQIRKGEFARVGRS